jgi:hypothetical protein
MPAWIKHMEATLIGEETSVAPKDLAPLLTQNQVIEFSLPEEERDDSVYLGPHWHGVSRMTQTDAGILARMQIPAAYTGEPSTFRYHPSLTDAALNLPIQATAGSELYLPYVYRGLHIYERIPGAFYSIVERIAGAPGADTMTYRAHFVDDSGKVLAVIDEYVTKKVTAMSGYMSNEFYQMQWNPWQGELHTEPSNGSCLVFGEDSDLLRALGGHARGIDDGGKVGDRGGVQEHAERRERRHKSDQLSPYGKRFRLIVYASRRRLRQRRDFFVAFLFLPDLAAASGNHVRGGYGFRDQMPRHTVGGRGVKAVA